MAQRRRRLPDAEEFQPVVTGAVFRERTKEWPANRKSWSALQVARYNRLLLEEGLQAQWEWAVTRVAAA